MSMQDEMKRNEEVLNVLRKYYPEEEPFCTVLLVKDTVVERFMVLQSPSLGWNIAMSCAAMEQMIMRVASAIRDAALGPDWSEVSLNGPARLREVNYMIGLKLVHAISEAMSMPRSDVVFIKQDKGASNGRSTEMPNTED